MSSFSCFSQNKKVCENKIKQVNPCNSCCDLKKTSLSDIKCDDFSLFIVGSINVDVEVSQNSIIIGNLSYTDLDSYTRKFYCNDCNKMMLY